MRSKEICFIKVIVIQRKEDNMNVKYLYQMFPTKEKRNHFFDFFFFDLLFVSFNSSLSLFLYFEFK